MKAHKVYRENIVLFDSASYLQLDFLHLLIFSSPIMYNYGEQCRQIEF